MTQLLLKFVINGNMWYWTGANKDHLDHTFSFSKSVKRYWNDKNMYISDITNNYVRVMVSSNSVREELTWQVYISILNIVKEKRS